MLLSLVFLLLLPLCFGTILLLTRPSHGVTLMLGRLKAIRALNRPPGMAMREEREDTQVPSRLTMLAERMSKTRLGQRAETLILQAGSRASLGRVAALSAALAGGGFVAAMVVAACWGRWWLMAGPPLLCAGMALPWLWLRRKRIRRLAAFSDRLPDALDLMARALRAGHSVAQMLEVLGEQTREPIRGEFAQVHQEGKLGVPFREAMLALSRRVPSQDLRFVVTAILVQKETGGDLTEILDRTAFVIRERLRVAGEVQTYTAQGRLTGWILSLLPVALLLLISLITPSYMTIMFRETAGLLLLGLGAAMIATGAFLIQRIVKVVV